MPAFSKEESLTRLVGEYYNCTRQDSGEKEFTYHSFVNLDKKSREHGIRALRKYFNNNNSKILWAQIKCNISNEIIETLKTDSNYTPINNN